MTPFKAAILPVAIASLIGCGSLFSGSASALPPVNFSISQAQHNLGISEVPVALADQFTGELRFNRYTSVVAPNGKAIHIVSQDQLTDNQIIRARSVLEHYLTDFKGSKFGSNKSAVANKMADNGAVLMLLNGSDDGTNDAAELEAQPLFHDEIQVEGGPWYMAQNYEHRDATFEEILHLVHDYGIGVDGYDQFIGALPAYQAEIRRAQVAALDGKIWAMSSEVQDWLEELRQENSLSQEYLASVADSYYGLWGAYKHQPLRMLDEYTGGWGMWGFYIASTREEVEQRDPRGYRVMTDFFQPYLTYNARIDESFNGTFSLKFDSELLYTNQSRYLKDITLTGNNPVNVVVNELDNNISGNQGENTVVFSGLRYEYDIRREGATLVVDDHRANRDGVNRLTSIEALSFTDGVLPISVIK
ncbi:hypothetical protein [Vibrio sp. SCSIO 43137]|uniref:hypothetical protein n=1 Tax=Vibrio sp. SCSIO 43137 TaxID=3021011 RepID=UPI00230765A6|nr:hypothetical protein [Vibrio sp. SCSIO 43137]WCE30785.1 hypothetical protein PK654_05795 [Vibrio sp. SCSIO 43137]